MDEMDEYQEWLFLTWGYGSDATYLTKGLLRMRDTNQGVYRVSACEPLAGQRVETKMSYQDMYEAMR